MQDLPQVTRTMRATGAKFSTTVKLNKILQSNNRQVRGGKFDRYSNWDVDQDWTGYEPSNTWSNTSGGFVNESKSKMKIAPVLTTAGSSTVPAPDNRDIAVQLKAADVTHISKSLDAISNELDGLEMPSGYHYLILDDVNHSLALIAYIGRRSKRTVCGLASGQSTEETQRILAKVSNQNICLRSHRKCHKVPGPSADDYFVCWGLPKNVRHWVSNLKSLGGITRICIVLSSRQHRQMVREQPISTSHIKKHPLSELLNTSLKKLMPSPSVTAGAQVKVLDSAQEPSTNDSPRTKQWTQTASEPLLLIPCPLPEGHHHIVLNELLDTIPLISYLALQSTTTLCYLDAGSPWDSYVALLNRVTGIETTYCAELPDVKIKEAMKDFTSKPQGIMLRPAGKGWNAGLRKPVVGCVIYCGIPKGVGELRVFYSCKAKHSYLIVSQLQSAGLVARESFGGNQHPSTNLFNNDKECSVLHELRLKTGAVLTNMDSPPIPVDQYKALQSRREPSDLAKIHTFAISNYNLQAAQASSSSFVCPLPEGHYYIILSEPLDAIPLISYLSIRSNKCLCYLTVDKSRIAYQQLFNRMTNIQTMYCNQTPINKLKRTMDEFGERKTAILLRPIDDRWDSCLKRLLRMW